MVVYRSAGNCPAAGPPQPRGGNSHECTRPRQRKLAVAVPGRHAVSSGFSMAAGTDGNIEALGLGNRQSGDEIGKCRSCTRRAFSGLRIDTLNQTLFEPVVSFPAALSNSSVALACAALTGAYSREPLGTGPIRQGWRSLASGLTAVCLLQETCEFLDQQHCVDRFRQVSVHRGRDQKEEIGAAPHSCR